MSEKREVAIREKRIMPRSKRPLDAAEQAGRMLEQAEWAEKVAAQVPRRRAAAAQSDAPEESERRAG